MNADMLTAIYNYRDAKKAEEEARQLFLTNLAHASDAAAEDFVWSVHNSRTAEIELLRLAEGFE